MRLSAPRSLALCILVLPLIAAGPAAAAEEPPASVGRVSFVAGPLGFHGTGETAWSPAAVNYPVATGGSFRTDAKAHAEFRIGAQTIALAGDTEIAITRLDQQVMQLAVPQGRVELQLRQLGEGNSVEIDIPRGGVWLLQPGIYDIDAGSGDQPARVMVFEGSARFVGGTIEAAIKAGEAAVIGGAETLTVAMEKAAPDAFVQWCRTRDDREERLASPYYLSRRMTGYEALDEYGAWRAVPDYGEVWFPGALPAGWVPYRHGYWRWIAPWGWNWIAAEPWGFAPFHYGRWASVDGAWGWVPGGFVAEPVYAPALVAYLSDPAAIVAARVAGALTGWFPLGPGEAYWPSYSSDPSYLRAVNAGIVGDPQALADPAGAARSFANRAAATVVSQRAFAASRPVAQSALPLSRAATQAGSGAAAARGATAAAGRGGPVVASRTAHGGGRTFRGGAAVSRGGGMAFRGGGGGHGGGGPHGGGMAVPGGSGGGHVGGGGGHGGGGGGGGHGGGKGHH